MSVLTDLDLRIVPQTGDVLLTIEDCYQDPQFDVEIVLTPAECLDLIERLADAAKRGMAAQLAAARTGRTL